MATVANIIELLKITVMLVQIRTGKVNDVLCCLQLVTDKEQ